MKISLVISAHNEELRLPTCLESIQKALASHPCNAEILVVANACSDKTADIARSFSGVRVVEEPRKGLSRARQTGFEQSTGELIANLDADIVMPPEWLPTVFKHFESEPELVALSGPFVYYDLTPAKRALVKGFYAWGFIWYILFQTLGVGSMLQGGNFVVRRTALEKIGGFDTSFQFYGEDTDAARRLSAVGPVKFTFKLPMNTSGRRLDQEGIIKSGMRYAVNYFWTTIAAEPLTKQHEDIRTP